MASSSTSDKDDIYVSLLKSTKSLDVDWKKFATEIGIQTTSNAQRKLKDRLKKDGLALTAGNPSIIGSSETGETDIKKVKTDTNDTKTETKRTPKSASKRKPKKDDSDEDFEDTPTKKTKVKDVLQDDEDEE